LPDGKILPDRASMQSVRSCQQLAGAEGNGVSSAEAEWVMDKMMHKPAAMGRAEIKRFMTRSSKAGAAMQARPREWVLGLSAMSAHRHDRPLTAVSIRSG